MVVEWELAAMTHCLQSLLMGSNRKKTKSTPLQSAIGWRALMTSLVCNVSNKTRSDRLLVRVVEKIVLPKT
jgi:hypothetical protein